MFQKWRQIWDFLTCNVDDGKNEVKVPTIPTCLLCNYRAGICKCSYPVFDKEETDKIDAEKTLNCSLCPSTISEGKYFS